MIAGRHLHRSVKLMGILRESSRRERVKATGRFEVGTFDKVTRRIIQVWRDIGLELSTRIFLFRLFLRKFFIALLFFISFLLNCLLFFCLCFPMEKFEFLLAFLLLHLRVFILSFGIFATFFFEIFVTLWNLFLNLGIGGRLFEFFFEVRVF